MITDCADVKVGQFSFYTFRSFLYSDNRLRRCEGRSVQLLHNTESKYIVMTDCEDAKVGQFSFYTFQRVSIKC